MVDLRALISADPCVATCHVIGRLLDLSHICQLADMRRGSPVGSHMSCLVHVEAVRFLNSESAGETSTVWRLTVRRTNGSSAKHFGELILGR